MMPSSTALLRRGTSLLVAGPLVAGAALAGPARGATIHVPDDYPTIQFAVVFALNGDEVVVAPGVYQESVNMAGRRITLISSGGPAVTTIDGGGAGSVLLIQNCEADTVVQGFTITGGLAGNGGGLHMLNASPVIRDCVIEDNVAHYYGGGAWSDGGAPAFEQCVIRDNVAGSACPGGAASGAGVFVTGGAITLAGCELSSNRIEAPNLAIGAGLCTIGANVQMDGTSVSGNDASAAAATIGAGVSHSGSFVLVADCSIESNRGAAAATQGAGARHEDSVVSMHDTVIRDNGVQGAARGGAGSGGGISEAGTSSSFVRCEFLDNALGGNGGALFTTGGDAILMDCQVAGNQAMAGGGVHVSGSSLQIGSTSFCDNEPTDVDGPLSDLGGNTFGACCSGDLSGPAGVPDGTVDAIDFLLMFAQWGACADCPGDVNGDGVVDALDFLELVAAWGPC